MILQQSLPYSVSPAPRLPGIAPCDMADWLHADDAYAGQMAERAHLLRSQRDAVLSVLPEAEEAAQELFDTVLAHLPTGFTRAADHVLCPDGRRVPLDRSDPLATLGCIVQEDLCLMQPRGEVHALTGAVLCFPASWMLAEKIGKPLLGIHRPVEGYEGDLERRVQRLFHGIREDKPLWRFNALYYDDPTLFQPRSETARRAKVDWATAPYLRTERQCLVRLPRTQAVVFSIHTYVVLREAAEALEVETHGA